MLASLDKFTVMVIGGQPLFCQRRDNELFSSLC